MIWIIGNKGMLGQELCLEFGRNGIEYAGTDMEISILDDKALCDSADMIKPDWIINCSAYTAVDKAEDEADSAYSINELGVSNIARIASVLDIPLIHISTDYVFSGTSGTPLSEDELVDPQSVYGKSKLAGEEALKKNCVRYLIIRTSWLYGQYGPNFVSTMLKLMNDKESINIVSDQLGSPSWTRILTGLIRVIIEKDSNDYGIYHLSGEGQCSWFEFAEEIYRLGRKYGIVRSECSINPCGSDEFPAKAKRPRYSLLSKEKVKTIFGYSVPFWQESLNNFLKEIMQGGVEII